ncbi:hypothetical protein H4R18_005041 [Coemansia javaensis]|uniref:Histone-lysine N-methyltransferase n=1 Tax=Coemansia javaensis TaxID=2761396 RepID=A0A9W8H7N6_9FUNG|nr:hypothetical protein H4R18_005041 [Coemansia javaensis]
MSAGRGRGRGRGRGGGRGRGRRGARGAGGGAGGDDSYTVEAILNDVTIDGVSMYELKWEGYSSEHNRWVAEWDLDCPELVAEYRRKKVENTADVSPFYKVLQSALEHHPITVVNTVDDVGCPDNFVYINESVYTDDVPRPCTPLLPCECSDGCVAECPCVRAQYYDSAGRVQVPPGMALMECGPACGCGPGCSTRVVQRGSGVKFEIRRYAGKGWGVVARDAVPCGTFVSEYVGELISFEEAEARGFMDAADGLTYLFDIDMACAGNEVADFSIDAKTLGNISHFFNHSCDPNLEIRPVYIEHRDPRLHHLAFFAARDIAPGEELTFDYCPTAADGPAPAGALPAEGSGSGTTFACRCGSTVCRGIIFP